MQIIDGKKVPEQIQASVADEAKSSSCGKKTTTPCSHSGWQQRL